jgi:3-oxoacyl-[acyl-carrier-protein] synthase III
LIFGDGAAAIVIGPEPEGSPPDIEYMQTYASGIRCRPVAGYAVRRIDPAVVAPDDQAAPTGESVEVLEPVDMPAGAETAVVAFA